MLKRIPLAFLGCFLLVSTALALGPRAQAKVIKVVDGDTIRVSIDGRTEPLRLIGIDAPESSVNEKAFRQAARNETSVAQMVTAGHKAAKFLEAKLPSGTVLNLEFDVTRRDKFNRLLAYAFLPDGSMLNKTIIREGFAYPLTIPPNVRYSEDFLKLFRAARSAKAGLWATHTSGDYLEPATK